MAFKGTAVDSKVRVIRHTLCNSPRLRSCMLELFGSDVMTTYVGIIRRGDYKMSRTPQFMTQQGAGRGELPFLRTTVM